MPVIWKYSKDARKIVENVYKFCVEKTQPGLKMSLERAWDRTAALAGVSRATAQRILTAIAVDRPGSNSNKSDSGLLKIKRTKNKAKLQEIHHSTVLKLKKCHTTRRQHILIKMDYAGLELTTQRFASRYKPSVCNQLRH